MLGVSKRVVRSYIHTLKNFFAIGTWRDMHMRIEGDAVNDLQEIFLTIWNKETKQNIGGEAYFPQHEESILFKLQYDDSGCK